MLKLDGHRGKVRALAFSPDGTRLASVAGRERRVSLWNLPGGTRERSPACPSDVRAVAFDPSGEGVVLSSDRYLRRWDLAAGVVEDRWRRAASDCRHLAFRADGSLLAVACYSHNGYADCYRVDLFTPDPAAKKTFLPGDYGAPYCMTLSADGRFLAAGGENRLLRVWNLADGRKSWSWEFAYPPAAVALSADGSAAAVSVATSLTVFDTGTRKPLGELVGHNSAVLALAFAPDGTLLSAGDDGITRLWEVPSARLEGGVAAGRERAAFDWKVGPASVVAFSPDGALAAVGGADGLVVWDVG